MAGLIEIPYKPRVWAQQLHSSKQRWKVLVLHRRAGKTVGVINHLIKDALLTPNSRFAYIAPTYKQAKNIVWDYLKFYSRPIPGIKPNESELKIDYPNNGRIQLFGSENVDALRGMALWGGAQDESSQQPSNLFSEVISKCLADHLGYWIWLGTPKGKNQFHRTYKASINNPDYFSMFRTIDDSLREEQGETINNLRIALEDDRKLVLNNEMTSDEFEQEWYCSFEAAIRGAYYSKEVSRARQENRVTNIPYDPSLPVYTFWDLGISDYTTIGFFQLTGKEARLIDYYQNNGFGLDHYVKILREKPYSYGGHYFPHDVEVRELGSGRSRSETLESLGVRVNVVPNISVMDGINATRLIWSSLWIDQTKCQEFIDAISQYRQDWDDKKGMFRDTPLHDWTSHCADMLRYFAVGSKNIVNNDISKIMDYNEKKYNPGRFI